jgi:hypothetical protein
LSRRTIKGNVFKNRDIFFFFFFFAEKETKGERDNDITLFFCKDLMG